MIHDIFFSVMICCYNSEKYLRETLDSVINQTHQNWEIVIINDGSTDKTEEIILEYKNDGVPIIYFKQENQGFAAARNKAVELSNGEWIAIIDHDDVCFPRRFEIQADDIKKNADANLFFANTVYFTNDGVEISRHFERVNPCEMNLSKGNAMSNLLAYGGFIPTSSVTFNKKAALSVGGFDTSYRYVVDYDFFLKMGLKFNFCANEELVSKWRVHEGQLTQKIRPEISSEMRRIVCKYFFLDGVTNQARLKIVLNAACYFVRGSRIPRLK